MTDNRDFKGVWIPKEIWFNPDLSAIDKVIYAEICSLDNDTHCHASNEYLAKFCCVSESTVYRSIKKLKELKLIDEVHNDGRIRILKASSQFDYPEKSKRPFREVKMTIQSSQNDISEESKRLPISININKDININNSSNSKDTLKDSFNENSRNIKDILTYINSLTDFNETIRDLLKNWFLDDSIAIKGNLSIKQFKTKLETIVSKCLIDNTLNLSELEDAIRYSTEKKYKAFYNKPSYSKKVDKDVYSIKETEERHNEVY